LRPPRSSAAKILVVRFHHRPGPAAARARASALLAACSRLSACCFGPGLIIAMPTLIVTYLSGSERGWWMRCSSTRWTMPAAKPATAARSVLRASAQIVPPSQRPTRSEPRRKAALITPARRRRQASPAGLPKVSL
jgi:hypothetical protein